ncbi:unnamed protein product [Amaranthus hypochondriacus]
MSSLVDSLKNMSIENGDPFYWAAQACPVLNSPVDWKETPESHIFVLDLPGVNKDAVKIEFDQDRVLQISGDRGHQESREGEKWHRIERIQGKFCRRFQLPENVKVDEVRANMENGVLKVVVPKHEVKKPEKKVIEIVEK